MPSALATHQSFDVFTMIIHTCWVRLGSATTACTSPLFFFGSKTKSLKPRDIADHIIRLKPVRIKITQKYAFISASSATGMSLCSFLTICSSKLLLTFPTPFALKFGVELRLDGRVVAASPSRPLPHESIQKKAGICNDPPFACSTKRLLSSSKGSRKQAVTCPCFGQGQEETKIRWMDLWQKGVPAPRSHRLSKLNIAQCPVGDP